MSMEKKRLSKTGVEKRVLRILEKAHRVPRFQASREGNSLIDAIRHGHSEIALALLDHGVGPNFTDAKGKSALWHAAHWGRSNLIRDLVGRGAKLPDDVLMGPVDDGDVELVRFLIRHDANVNCVTTFTRYDWKFPQKKVLLTEAIQNISLHKSAEQAADLIRAGKTPKWRAKHSPGLRLGDPKQIPIMLIKAGAQVNRLAAEYSIYEGFIPTMLGLASGYGYEKIVKAMLAADADVNFRDTWGGTALFSAAKSGQINVAKMLLAAGARKDIKRKDGTTPSSIAREAGFIKLADLLAK